MRTGDKISQRQLLAMFFVGLFSPAVRLLPGQTADFAGSASWLSPLVAAVPILLLLLLLFWFIKNRGENEGLYHLMIKSIGGFGGKAVALLIAVWLTFYAGFILRTASERLLSSVYESGGPGLFLVLTLAVSIMAALGKVGSLARTAEVFVPVLGVVLVTVLGFSMTDVRPENLLPVTPDDLGGILLGAVPVVDIMCAYAYFLFLFGYVRKEPGAKKKTIIWTLWIIAAIFVIIVGAVGSLSAPLTEKMQNPFFVMVKNVTIFGIVERLEAVVVALWVLTDFIFLSALLMIGSEIFRSVFKAQKRSVIVWPVSAAVLAVALLISKSAFELEIFSEMLIPLANLAVVLVIIPAVLLIGKIRKKI